MDKSGFGERVRQQLEQLGAKDAWIAKRAGLSTSTFARYKAGDSVPNAAQLFPLSDALGASPRWLLYGEAADGPLMADARDAQWVSLPRFDLAMLSDTSKGDPIESIPYRKDWLQRRLLRTAGLWITELPSDYEALNLEEGDAVVCSDIDAGGPQEKWVCIFKGLARPFVARYSNRGSSEIDLPGASTITAADLASGDIYSVARIHARMLAKL